MADSKHSFMDSLLLTPIGSVTRIDREDYGFIDFWLSPGDRIYWQRPYAMIHASIVLATNQAKRKICVFERTKDNGFCGVDVNVVSLDEQAGQLYRCNDDDEAVPLSKRLRIMLTKLGDKGYNLFGKNCQNLVTECSLNQTESFQSKWFGVNLVMQAIKGFGMRAASAEMVEALFGGAEKVGVITIVALQATFFLMEFYSAYEKLKNGNISWKHFVELVIRQFSMAMFSCVGSAVGGSLVGYLAVKPIVAVVLGVFTAHIASMLLDWVEVDNVLTAYLGWMAGGILGFMGGFLASGWVLETLLACLLGFGGLLIGHGFGYVASWLFNVDGADSRIVNDLSELKMGDHITKYDWYMHPNCHAIFIKTLPDNKMKVIGNSFREGVSEQILTFTKGEVYRYEYHPLACYKDDEVVRNATSKIGEPNKSWTKCDCKAFAKECKCRNIRDTHTVCPSSNMIDWDALFAKIISEPGLPDDKIARIEYKLQMLVQRVSPIHT
ncbi:hypothetical protein HOLleu_15430 [Holothuria leucospilota]|uniref:LRAT domain-containing protein n=1 Tax=Holothuria leucospilota TaxID=206669 RepID=A0A9Q1HCG9_HOLLE|nr:hypothetical protein HOLleu_15430 [Holothuria leucospilota]